MLLSVQVHYVVCGLVGLAGLLAIAFGIMRGGRVRARLPFMLGGFVLVCYAGLFAVVQFAGRSAALAKAGESLGRASEQTQMVSNLMAASFPTALLEPIAIWMLALGFGAIARASDARGAAGAPAGPGPDEETEDEMLFGSGEDPGAADEDILGAEGDDDAFAESDDAETDLGEDDDAYPFDDE